MTKSQKEKIFSVFYATDTEISSIHALDFLIHTCDKYEDWQDEFESIDVRNVFGERIGQAYENNDGDLAAYLWEKGGIFIYANTQLPDWKTVKFQNDSKWVSYSLLPYSVIIGVWAPDYDRAICKLAAKVLKMKNAEVKKARKKQGIV